VGAELDALALLGSPAFSGKQIYLPVISPGLAHTLKFAALQQTTHWRKNRHGIFEPCLRSAALRRPCEMDLVVAPLVGFDASGARLGAGGGYYDRSFAFRNNRARWRRPRLLGLAFERQRREHIAVETWDVRMDAIVTEQKIYPR